MPTKPRIDFAGYHHIINRGVNRCNIFNHNNDKNMLLQIINKIALRDNVILHTYVLMDNHYHLLIETKKENLSSFMRVINANYAQYFNKKYKRSGHLWQDRYKSKFIISEEYLYTLIKYIEQNPLESKIVKNIGDYQFTLFHNIINNKEIMSCCKESILLKDFKFKEMIDFLEIQLNENDIKFLEEKHNQNMMIKNKQLIVSKIKTLKEYFFNQLTSINKRNLKIIEAYNHGYSQAELGRFLNLSKSSISKIIKSGDSTPGVLRGVR